MSLFLYFSSSIKFSGLIFSKAALPIIFFSRLQSSLFLLVSKIYQDFCVLDQYPFVTLLSAITKEASKGNLSQITALFLCEPTEIS